MSLARTTMIYRLPRESGSPKSVSTHQGRCHARSMIAWLKSLPPRRSRRPKQSGSGSVGRQDMAARREHQRRRVARPPRCPGSREPPAVAGSPRIALTRSAGRTLDLERDLPRSQRCGARRRRNITMTRICSDGPPVANVSGESLQTRRSGRRAVGSSPDRRTIVRTDPRKPEPPSPEAPRQTVVLAQRQRPRHQNLDAWVTEVSAPSTSAGKGQKPGGSPRRIWGAMCKSTCRSARTASRIGASTTWAIQARQSHRHRHRGRVWQVQARRAAAALWLCERMGVDPVSLGWKAVASFARQRISTAASSRRTASPGSSFTATRTSCVTATIRVNGSNGLARIGARRRPHWRSSSAASFRASSLTTPRRKSGNRCATLALRAAWRSSRDPTARWSPHRKRGTATRFSRHAGRHRRPAHGRAAEPDPRDESPRPRRSRRPRPPIVRSGSNSSSRLLATKIRG